MKLEELQVELDSVRKLFPSAEITGTNLQCKVDLADLIAASQKVRRYRDERNKATQTKPQPASSSVLDVAKRSQIEDSVIVHVDEE